jgi:glucose-6-phosphate-specific signal transduction histidine kinase
MNEIIKNISDIAPFAMIGALLGIVLSSLQVLMSRKERKHEAETLLKVEEELRKQLASKDQHINELQKQLNLIVEKLAVEKSSEAEIMTIERLAKELVEIRKQLGKKEGQR